MNKIYAAVCKGSAGLKWLALRIPLVKTLFRAKFVDFREAGMEFGIVWIFSAIPIAFSILVDYYTKASVASGQLKTDVFDLAGIYDRLRLNLNGGEIFIYIISFLGTVAFVLYKYNRAGKTFEDFWPVVLIGGGIALVSVAIFCLQRSNMIKRYDLVNVSAAWMYVVTLFLFFVALLYEQRRTGSYQAGLRTDEATLMAQVSGYDPSKG